MCGSHAPTKVLDAHQGHRDFWTPLKHPSRCPRYRVNIGGICGQAALWEVLKIQIPSLFSGGR